VKPETSFAGLTIMAVFAHPDDESLACGGTLARLSDGGARIVLLCASHGERGASTGPARDDALGRARIGEMRQAAAALGISDLVLLNHPDGDLRWADVTELHAEIVMAIRTYAPDAIITFGEDGLYWHPDHIAVYERTTTAVRSIGSEGPPLYYATAPRALLRPLVDAALARGWRPPPKGFWSLVPEAFGLAAETPTMVVDVRPWATRKLAALRAHESQTGSDSPLVGIDDQAAQRWLGLEHFHRASASSTSLSSRSVLEALCT
jgi:LmbE family N-acetylglucosaminyl deacetylase